MLVPSEGGSYNLTSGVNTNVLNISSNLTTFGDNWTVEFWCENFNDNTSRVNLSRIIINQLPIIDSPLYNYYADVDQDISFANQCRASHLPMQY